MALEMDHASGRPERFGHGLELLLVDDEATIRYALREALGDCGFAVAEAADLAAARAAVAATRFDVVVLDKNLPDGSGLELAQELSGPAADCAVVLISAYANVTSAVAALRSGVADYIQKPFDLDDLVARLKRVVEVQSLGRANRELVETLRRQNSTLEALVVRDPLTQLYNHVHFQECLERELSRCRRHDLKLGLVLLDVDTFRGVNDAHGHAAGDALLRALGALLRGSSRITDDSFRVGDNDIAARYGGDQFALLLPETSKQGAATTAERLRQTVSRHGPELGLATGITLSAGVAGYPDDATDRAGLVKAADAALGAAKRSGRNRLVSYTPSLSAAADAAAAEVAQLDALARTIAARSVNFLYQAVVSLPDGALHGYEALCRPADPAFKGPLELIDAAERAGRVCELGRVLREQAVAPLDRLAAPGRVFVNLHPQEIFDPELFAEDSPLTRCASRVVLEVTESAAIDDYGRARDALDRLRARGFRIALDDLGAGYSGLNSLALLGPDYVKLDITMVQAARGGDRSARLIRHLLDFADGEGMHVVAEGIETSADLEAIGTLGVRLAQGYFIARPAPAFATPRQLRAE